MDYNPSLDHGQADVRGNQVKLPLFRSVIFSCDCGLLSHLKLIVCFKIGHATPKLLMQLSLGRPLQHH